MSVRRPFTSGLVLGVAVLAALVAVGCAPSDGRTALAARHPRWTAPDRLVVEVECADDVTVTGGPAAGANGVPLVTIWGEPNRDGCWTDVSFTLPPGTPSFEDAATGTQLAIPPPPNGEPA